MKTVNYFKLPHCR